MQDLFLSYEEHGTYQFKSITEKLPPTNQELFLKLVVKLREK